MSFKEKAAGFAGWTGLGFAVTQVSDFVFPFSMSWQENGLAGVMLATGVMVGRKFKGGVDTGDVVRAADNARRFRRNQ